MNKQQLSVIFRRNLEKRGDVRQEAEEALKAFLAKGEKVTICPTSKRKVKAR